MLEMPAGATNVAGGIEPSRRRPRTTQELSDGGNEPVSPEIQNENKTYRYHGRNNNYISNSKKGKNVTVSRINSKNGAKMQL